MAGKTRTTQLKKAKEQRRFEKARRKKDQKLQRKLDVKPEQEEELKPLNGPVYFTDFDVEDIRI